MAPRRSLDDTAPARDAPREVTGESATIPAGADRQAAAPARVGPDPKAGTQVGRYLLLEPLGVGGMGQVWSAYDPQLERKIAVKLLQPGPSPAGGEAGQAALLAEAQAMAKLSHPNVLPIYDVGIWQGQVFLAMELADAGDLKRWLQMARPPARKVVEVFVAAGRGLAAAHAAGIVHCDFKPANVLLTRGGAVRVADFGVASTETPGDQEVPGAGAADGFVGTMGFAAPELVDGGAATQLSDQFAFCVAVWKGLFEELPYPALTALQFRDAVRKGPPVPPPGRKVPRRVVRVLARGLAARPADRFPSMPALLAELDRDPLRVLERRAVPLASLLLAALAVAGAAAWYHRDATRCERAASATAQEAWSAAGREAVFRAFAESKLPAESARNAQEELDRYFARWRDQQAAACEAARRDPANSGPLGCLERRLGQAKALVAVLGRPRADLASSLGAALDGTDRPEDCSLQASAPAREETAELRALRAATMECVAALRFQRYAEALASAPPLLAQARRLDARAEVADLSGVLAVATWAVHGAEGVLPLQRDAIRAADASGIAELGAMARQRLAFFLLETAASTADAEQALLDAEVWIERAGRPPRLEIRNLGVRADLASRQDKVEEALALAKRKVELVRALQGPASRAYADAQSMLGAVLWRARHLAEAAAVHADALRVLEQDPAASAVEKALAVGNLALIQLERGRIAEAREGMERAVAILPPADENSGAYSLWCQVARGSIAEFDGRFEVADSVYELAMAARTKLDKPDQAEVLAGRARSLLRQGRTAEALPLAREAEELTAGFPGAFALSSTRFTLAQALWATGDKAAGLRAAREAEQMLTGPEDGFGRGQIQAWIAERSKPAR